MVFMKTIKTKLIGLGCVLLLLVIGLSVNAYAIEPQITDIVITNNEENVLLYARLKEGFKPEIVSAIMAGVPTVFTLHLNVYEERSYIWDKTINSNEIERTIKYDNLKKMFSIFTNGKPDPAIFSDLKNAMDAMADFNGIVVMPISELKKGQKYYLKIKIEMDKVHLPLGMENIFFFVSFWDFETSWYEKKFLLK